jgi:hypothetical protein
MYENSVHFYIDFLYEIVTFLACSWIFTVHKQDKFR